MDVAKGAALMTGTSFEVDFLAGCYDVLPNETLARVAMEELKEVGAPKWSSEDHSLRRNWRKSLDRRQTEAGLKSMNAPAELFSQTLNTTVVEPLDRGKVMPGSTDVGDVELDSAHSSGFRGLLAAGYTRALLAGDSLLRAFNRREGHARCGVSHGPDGRPAAERSVTHPES